MRSIVQVFIAVAFTALVIVTYLSMNDSDWTGDGSSAIVRPGAAVSAGDALGVALGRTRRLKVIGAVGSGDDFVHRLLTVNLERFVSSAYTPSCQGTGGKSAVRVCDDTTSGIPRHVFPVGPSVQQLQQDVDNVVVAVVRAPLAHIEAISRSTSGSDLQACLGPPHFGLPPQHCTIGTRQALGTVDDTGEPVDRIFAGITDVLSSYTEGYLRLKENSAALVLVVPFEEAVLRPDDLVQRVFRALNVGTYLDSQVIVPEMVGDVGLARGMDEARRQIERRSYLESPFITARYAARVCSLLEPATLRKFVVPSTPARSYFDECDEQVKNAGEAPPATTEAPPATTAAPEPEPVRPTHAMPPRRKPPPPPGMKRLKVMGSWNSGTNFIHRLLRRNLEVGLPNNGFIDRSPGYPTRWPTSCESFKPGIVPKPRAIPVKSRDPAPISCDDTWSGSGIHKHTFPIGKWMDELMSDPNAVVVAMVRSPIAHLAAMLKAPYDFRGCMSGPHYGRPGHRCVLEGGVGLYVDKEGKQISGDFTSAANFIQEFMKGFAHYRDNAAGTMVIIPYEEAVLDEAAAIRKIFAAIGYEENTPNPIVPFDEAAKEHGAPVGTNAAREKVIARAHLKSRSLNEDYIRASCTELDPAFLKQFVIPTDPPRTYWDDCEKYLR